MSIKGTSIVRGFASGHAVCSERWMTSHVPLENPILVSENIHVGMFNLLAKCKGVVTAPIGSATHVALFMKQQLIPCIAVSPEILQQINDGQHIAVSDSSLYLQDSLLIPSKEVQSQAHWTYHGNDVFVSANMAVYNKHTVEVARKSDSRGIGLIHAEFILFTFNHHPYAIQTTLLPEFEDYLYTNLAQLFSSFAPHRCRYRLIDFDRGNTQYFPDGPQYRQTVNPAMGVRGIRDLSLVPLQTRVLKRLFDDGHTNFVISVAMPTQPSEFSRLLEILRAEGLDLSKIPVGITLETPAAAILIEEFIEAGILDVYLGMNDFTQFTLAVDRTELELQSLYDKNHPAIRRVIENVLKACAQHQVHVALGSGGVCNDTESTRFYLERGVTEYAIDLHAFPQLCEILSEVCQEQSDSK